MVSATASEVTATNFAFVSPAAGGVVAFWLTLCMLLLAGVIFLCCVFCHSGGGVFCRRLLTREVQPRFTRLVDEAPES